MLNVDKNLKNKVVPAVPFTMGGKVFHFKSNANITKAVQGFVSFHAGRLKAEDRKDIPKDENEKVTFILLTETFSEGNEEMRVGLLDMMIREDVGVKQIDELFEFYNAEEEVYDDKDSMVFSLLMELTPAFLEVVAGTQKPKASGKPKAKK